MVNEDDRAIDNSKPTPQFIVRLKQYKEFIAILVFFTGGFMWIYGFFATKSQVESVNDNVQVVHCLTNSSIILTETRMQKRFLLEELTQKSVELNNLLTKTDLSVAENRKLIILKAETDVIRENLMKANARHDEAYHNLKVAKCQFDK